MDFPGGFLQIKGLAVMLLHPVHNLLCMQQIARHRTDRRKLQELARAELLQQADKKNSRLLDLGLPTAVLQLSGKLAEQVRYRLPALGIIQPLDR